MEKSQNRLIIFMPSMEGGGVEKNLIIISNYLSKKLNNIALITFDKRFNKFFDKRIKIINSNFEKKKKFSKYFKYFICLIILVRELIKSEKISVISFQANMYCIFLSIFFNFKLIVRSNSSPSGWTKNFLKNYIFKIFFKFPNFVIVNSSEFKNEMKKKFNVNAKLIYNPLNLNEIKKKSKKKIKLDFFKNKNYKKIINIARFTDQKDHLTLLKGFLLASQNEKLKLLIIGYGPNKSKIFEFIKKNKLERVVKVMSFQENPYKYLKKSDLFILSSKFEGLPNVLLEAMSLKKFIISTNCPTGPREILNNGKYGLLFKIGDHKKLSRLILEYSKNQNKFNKLVINGYKSLKKYDYKNNCEKYLNLINKINH